MCPHFGCSHPIVQTQKDVDTVAKKCQEIGLDIGKIHAGYDWWQRDITVSEFRRGAMRILISTDLLAKGFDVVTIKYVFFSYLKKNY